MLELQTIQHSNYQTFKLSVQTIKQKHVRASNYSTFKLSNKNSQTFKQLIKGSTQPSLLLDFLWRVLDDLCGSDHFPIVIKHQGPATGGREPSWRLKRADWHSFRTLCDERLTADFHNSPEAIASFTDTLLSIADETVPKSSATPKHIVNPWLDADCEKAIKDRKKAERKFNRQPTAENLTTFKIKRAMARRVIKEKRRQCWRQFVSSINNRTPLSKVWSLIRRLKGKGGGGNVPEIEHIRDFILNTGRVRGMPLPGRLPGLRETEAYYLSADETQTEVYKQYKEAAERENRIPVKSSTFHSFWHDLVPNVKILSPSTDLCDVCQENSKKLVYSGHLSEEEKRERLEDSLAHLNAAKVEREYYNRQIISARDGPRESHISFDYAQQIHYPYNCQQVGSAFFKTPRKCGIFGTCEESPEDKQVNYLIDEAVMVGKGSNVVVMRAAHFRDVKHDI